MYKRKIYPIVGIITTLLSESIYAESRQVFEPETVKLPNGKWMGKYEVTIGEYMQCVNDGDCRNPVWLQEGYEMNINTGMYGDVYTKVGMSLDNKRHPVTGVSWNDAQKYIAWLNQKTSKKYSLPTEEEWFAACQAGQQTKYCGSNNADEVAWYENNSDGKTHPVGQKKANNWGLYDMSGNVAEWTTSFYGAYKSPKAVHGGSWVYSGQPKGLLLSVSRSWLASIYCSNSHGFRVSRK